MMSVENLNSLTALIPHELYSMPCHLKLIFRVDTDLYGTRALVVFCMPSRPCFKFMQAVTTSAIQKTLYTIQQARSKVQNAVLSPARYPCQSLQLQCYVKLISK